MGNSSIYCDESGGIGAGAISFAAVYISEEEAQALQSRFRDITGHRGELKGSKIDLTERGLFFELLEKTNAFATVGIVKRDGVSEDIYNAGGSDLRAYTLLLNKVVGALLPRTGGCGNVVIDEGRYDPQILEAIRQDIAGLLGNWGKAQMIDSKRSIGVQIADIIANSSYNIATGSARGDRIKNIMKPMVTHKRITLEYHSLNAASRPKKA